MYMSHNTTTDCPGTPTRDNKTKQNIDKKEKTSLILVIQDDYTGLQMTKIEDRRGEMIIRMGHFKIKST